MRKSTVEEVAIEFHKWQQDRVKSPMTIIGSRYQIERAPNTEDDRTAKIEYNSSETVSGHKEVFEFGKKSILAIDPNSPSEMYVDHYEYSLNP